MSQSACVFSKILYLYFRIGNHVHIKSSRVAPGMANARPLGSAKFANAPPPGLTRRTNVPQWPGGGGGRVQMELTDAKLFKQDSWSCRCTLISSLSLPGVESSLSIPLASSSSSERGKNNSSQSLFFDLVCTVVLLFWWSPFTVSPFSPAFLSSWKFKLLFDGGAKSV